ncbi:OmpA family protein [uncultured Capnocytophaga sp.]|uniref:OmpA family protein n=1 Tax=uncultured Capnocytophaga sp. TaxID=159273 RepID=UPI00263509F8|nr:OmpA family protein [uncultured Capnocytophaga sp.]
MNNIIKKGIIFILVFVPAIIFAQDKLYNQQREIVLSKEELQLLLQKIAEAKLRKIRGEKLANLHKSQQKKAVSNIYESNEVKNFYYLAQNADSTHTDIEQVNRKLDILLAYMMKKDSISVIHLTDTVKYVANSNLNRANYLAKNDPNAAKHVANNPNEANNVTKNNPNAAKRVANNPNAANYIAKNNPNGSKHVANDSDKDIMLQKQLDMIAKSIKDLSDQQKLLAAAMIPLTTLNNKDKLDNIQQRTDSILLLSKKQADQNNVQAPKETSVIVQNVKTTENNGGNSVISEERRRTLEDLLAKYGNKKTPIYFANNAYQPLPHDTDAIDQIVTMLRNNPELSILLEGYASNVGSAEYNNQLSMKRSESVARLLQKQGISLQRILTAFRGIDDSVDKEKARRVDISVIIR